MNIGSQRLSAVAFADDVLCLSRNSTEIKKQLQLILEWCHNWGMQISSTKTRISTLSDENNWTVQGFVGEDFSFGDSAAFTYLGVDFKVKGRDFLGNQYQKMITRADGYVSAILNTTRDQLDRSLVAWSLWNNCAIPAILYGSETCVLGKNILEELNKRQRRIAAFITGLPSTGGNIALSLESGLIPFEARYHIGLHRFFNRCLKSKCSLIIEALNEHSHGGWNSPWSFR